MQNTYRLHICTTILEKKIPFGKSSSKKDMKNSAKKGDKLEPITNPAV
jgi:hypothetical protein